MAAGHLVAHTRIYLYTDLCKRDYRYKLPAGDITVLETNAYTHDPISVKLTNSFILFQFIIREIIFYDMLKFSQ